MISSSASGFSDWTGFRFGANRPSGAGDYAWAVGKLPSGGFVIAGGDDDSGCCRWDSVGAFSAEPTQGPSAWIGWFDPDGSKRREHWNWGYLRGPVNRPRWFDLIPFPDGSVIAAGNIGDSVLFTGSERISYGTRTPDSLKTELWSEVIAKGGGGGMGIAKWSPNGNLEWTRLLRLGRASPKASSIAWQVAATSSGREVLLSGSIFLDSAGTVWDGADSLQLPSGSTCFVARFGIDGTKGRMIGTPCKRSEHASLALVGDHTVWMAQGDPVTTNSDTSAWGRYDGFRPFLARMDGPTPSILHPLGNMRGSFRAIAAHENGSILVQGEQASTLDWFGRPIAPRPDTTRGGIGPVIRTSFLLLADSTGKPVAFQSLKGFSNAGGWKIRRVPGRGWLLLSWDEQDLLGWSRLYLLDDSLNVLEMSDTLPPALDAKVASDGSILLSGYDRAPSRGSSWLSGSGTMWAATCRVQTPSVGITTPTSSSGALRKSGSLVRIALRPGETALLSVHDHAGRSVHRETVHDGSSYLPPRGIHILSLHRGHLTETVKTVR